MPPATLTRKSPVASKNTKLAPTAASAVLYATSAVPSLSRLSPSISDTIRRGTCRRRRISAGASASVGATIAPSTNATAHGMPGTSSCATTATTHIVTSTSPTACTVTTRIPLRMSCRFAKKADE